MKRILVLIAVFFAGMVGIANAFPMYYTYEGRLNSITTTPGGSSTYITDQGIALGDIFTFIFLVDFERAGVVTRNNGDTFNPHPDGFDSFYAALMYQSPEFNGINSGYNFDPLGIAEYNYGWVQWYPEGSRSNIYVGSGDALAHLDMEGFSSIPIYDWKEGQTCIVAFRVDNHLTLESAAGYTYGTITRISDINPVPEPSTLLLFASGLPGLAGMKKKLKKQLPIRL